MSTAVGNLDPAAITITKGHWAEIEAMPGFHILNPVEDERGCVVDYGLMIESDRRHPNVDVHEDEFGEFEEEITVLSGTFWTGWEYVPAGSVVRAKRGSRHVPGAGPSGCLAHVRKIYVN